MPIVVQIKTTGGETASVPAAYSDTVVDLKDKIERTTPLGCVRDLCRKGKVLDDRKTLADSGLEPNDVLIATVIKAKPDAKARPRAHAGAPGPADPTPGSPSPAQQGGDKQHTKKKCQKCGVPLNLVEQNMPCRCDGVFCDRHRAYEKHQCTFNHAMLARANLTQQLYSAQDSPEAQAGGAASRRAQSAFVYGEYCGSHRHPHSRAAHAAGFASLVIALAMSIGSEWDGVGVPTWMKRMLIGATLSYSAGYFGHSRPSSCAHGPAFCIWSSNVKTHPWQCVVCETRNLARVVADLVTNQRRNSLTPHVERYKRFFDPLQ
jgi:hypothetical protein